MKMNVKKFANKKLVACAALIAAGVTTAMAQGNGLAGINEATSMVTGTYRRREGVRQVLQRRSRHLEDRSLMVRCLYLPHRGRYHPALVLPLSLYIIIRYKEDNSE